MNEDTPKYMIGVAAELVGMHPQTLRLYETRGLVRPRRTAGGTRLYSDAELMRLRRITELASGLGLSLQGVEHVLALEDRVHQLEQQVADLGAALDEAARVMQSEVESVHRSYRHEIVPYIPPPGAELVIRRRRMR